MKNNNLKYIVTFVGAVLVLTALIAISKNLVAPKALNAQGLADNGLPQTSSLSLSPPKELETLKDKNSSGSLTISDSEKSQSGKISSLSIQSVSGTAERSGDPIPPLEVKSLSAENVQNRSEKISDRPVPSFPQLPSSEASPKTQSASSISLSSAPRTNSTAESEVPVLPSLSSAAQLPPNPNESTLPKTPDLTRPSALPPMDSVSSDVPFPALPSLPTGNVSKENVSPDSTVRENKNASESANAEFSQSVPSLKPVANSKSFDGNDQNFSGISTVNSKNSASGKSNNETYAAPLKPEKTSVHLSAPSSGSISSLPSGTANAPVPPLPNIPAPKESGQASTLASAQPTNANGLDQGSSNANGISVPSLPTPMSASVNRGSVSSAPLSGSSEFPGQASALNSPKPINAPMVMKPSSDFVDPLPVPKSNPSDLASLNGSGSKPALPKAMPTERVSAALSSDSARSVSESPTGSVNATAAYGALVGSGTPGESSLEGEQHAQVVLLKEMPEEIQVGREETFTIKVKNVGNRKAKEVVLKEKLPAKTKLIMMDPQGLTTAKGELVWNGFELNPDQERTFIYKAVPLEQGEIGSVASISFQSEASSKTRCTKPELKAEVSAPKEVEVGDDVPLEITVSNTGTGTATGIIIVENVPKGLTHPGGTVLDNQIDKIAAGEAKKLSLTLKGANPGKTVNVLKLTADNGTQKEIKTEIQVNAPELKLEISGAAQRYLERESTYILKVVNPGSASAKNITIEAKLPENITFVKTNNYGQYKKETNSVHWELVELPQNVEPGEIELTVMPSQLGKGKIILNASGDKGLSAQVSKEVAVDGLAALSYSIKPLSDVVEVGQNAVYEIRIANHGTKSSSNVNLQILVPDEMKVVSSEGPTQYRVQNGAFVFDNLPSIGAKQEIVYKIKAVCSAPGDHRIKVQVSSDDFERLVKEESIRAYH